jgi:hypothetical protein
VTAHQIEASVSNALLKYVVEREVFESPARAPDAQEQLLMASSLSTAVLHEVTTQEPDSPLPERK